MLLKFWTSDEIKAELTRAQSETGGETAKQVDNFGASVLSECEASGEGNKDPTQAVPMRSKVDLMRATEWKNADRLKIQTSNTGARAPGCVLWKVVSGVAV